MKEVSISLLYLCQHKNSGYIYNRYMTSNQCGVLFSDIDLRSFVYHNVHGHPEFVVKKNPEKLVSGVQEKEYIQHTEACL